MFSKLQERHKQRILVVLNILLSSVAAIFIGLVFKLNIYITVICTVVVLVLVLFGLQLASRQFED